MQQGPKRGVPNANASTPGMDFKSVRSPTSRHDAEEGVADVEELRVFRLRDPQQGR